MKQTFEEFIPPKSNSVIEFVGETADESDIFLNKEKFLLINPACKYTVSRNLEVDIKNADSVILTPSLFENITAAKLSDIINEIYKNLNDNTQVIFAIDNVAFGDNITALLNGQSPTVKTLIGVQELAKIIESSNLKLMKVLKIFRNTVVNKNLIELSKNELNIANYVISAVKKSTEIKKTLIQSYLGEVLVCASIRVLQANRFIATDAGIEITSADTKKPLNLYPPAAYDKKIFINQRVSFPTVEKGIEIFNKLVERNYLMVEEMDDHPILWQKQYEYTQFINFIACHALQTSTKPLAEFFRQFNPHTRVFENQLKRLPPARDFAAEAAQNKPVTIFFGALNRDKDIGEVLPAINKIAEEYGNKIAFKIIAKTELFDIIESTNKIMIGKKEIYNGQYVSYEEYEQALSSSDIALLPLKDNIFNRAKSDLKFIESAGCGVAVLASPTVYFESIEDGKTGLIYHDINEFYNKLKFLIDNPEKRHEMAENAYNYVKNNRLLSQHYEERIDWYNELLARLPELTAETYKRIELLRSNGAAAFGGF